MLVQDINKWLEQNLGSDYGEYTEIGQYNEIDDSVRLIPFKGCKPGLIRFGDGNEVREGVRILIGPEGFEMGDLSVVHNHCTFGGPGKLTIGHNCWFGQETWLDSSGGLTLGNGVRIGLRSHVWSHMASGEQVEGWAIVFRPTVLKDNVWLVGDDVHVASGITMGENSAALAHSTITRDCEPDTVYAGTPARPTSIRLREDVSLDGKLVMMRAWATEFATLHAVHIDSIGRGFVISTDDDRLMISTGDLSTPPNTTHFDLSTKTYTKRLTKLERDFVNFLKGNKARFLPI